MRQDQAIMIFPVPLLPFVALTPRRLAQFLHADVGAVLSASGWFTAGALLNHSVSRLVSKSILTAFLWARCSLTSSRFLSRYALTLAFASSLFWAYHSRDLSRYFSGSALR